MKRAPDKLRSFLSENNVNNVNFVEITGITIYCAV